MAVDCSDKHNLEECPIYLEIKEKHEALYALLKSINPIRRNHMWQVVYRYTERLTEERGRHLLLHKAARK